MLSVTIPGGKILKIENLVLDYNGTLALDGFLLPKVADLLTKIAEDLEIHVVTADTFGLAAQALAELPLKLSILGPSEQAKAKLNYVTNLGLDKTCAIGNGQNDHLMVKSCLLGLAIIGPEGASQLTVSAADIICTDIAAALSLFLHPLRLVASLRN
jgi:soluble P-type ATPase